MHTKNSGVETWKLVFSNRNKTHNTDIYSRLIRREYNQTGTD